MRKMFWIDLEMTGLDENTDRILEVAVLITDLAFNVVEEYHRIVYQPPEVLEAMGEWCKNTHGKSGLTAAVPKGTPLDVVEKDLIAMADKHYGSEKIVFCGNSVNMDQRFVMKYMPEFSKRVHYRVVDVTSFKEVFRSLYNVNVKKGEAHRALDDVRESISELKEYLALVKVVKAPAKAAP